MTILIYCLVFLLSLIISLPSLAAQYFVSPSGEDENPGMRERPWRTIAKANKTLQPGDTVTFFNGHYPGVIEPANSGREGELIVYRAENHLAAILTGGKSSDDHKERDALQRRMKAI